MINLFMLVFQDFAPENLKRLLLGAKRTAKIGTKA